MAIIETADLRKQYRTRQGLVEAVRGVDMRVEQGEIFGLLGPNGAGKTTTQRMLTTLLQPTSGAAHVAGHDLLREPALVRQHIGYVSQAGGADAGATARENLLLQGQLYGLAKPQAAARAAELIDALDLAACADRPVASYSGGQRRRLDLALGMVHRPALLFLDEPTTGLDPQSRARLWDEVRALRDQGTTVLLTTHYLDEADSLCDRVAIMDSGQIVACDTPEQLKREIAGDVLVLGFGPLAGDLDAASDALQSQPFVRQLYAQDLTLHLHIDHGASALPAVLRILDGLRIELQTVELTRPTLDDIFLRQTGRSLREVVQ